METIINLKKKIFGNENDLKSNFSGDSYNLLAKMVGFYELDIWIYMIYLKIKWYIIYL